MLSQVISSEDARTAFEYDRYFKIFPQIDFSGRFPLSLIEGEKSPIRSGIRVAEGFSFSSDTNSTWMSVEELRQWISTEYSHPSISQESHS